MKKNLLTVLIAAICLFAATPVFAQGPGKKTSDLPADVLNTLRPKGLIKPIGTYIILGDCIEVSLYDNNYSNVTASLLDEKGQEVDYYNYFSDIKGKGKISFYLYAKDGGQYTLVVRADKYYCEEIIYIK